MNLDTRLKNEPFDFIWKFSPTAVTIRFDLSPPRNRVVVFARTLRVSNIDTAYCTALREGQIEGKK